MNTPETHIFSMDPFVVGVSPTGPHPVPDALAKVIAATVLERLKPRAKRTAIDVGDENLALGYEYRITGFFPHERDGLLLLGWLDGAARRIGAQTHIVFAVVVREDPSVPPIGDDGPFGAN